MSPSAAAKFQNSWAQDLAARMPSAVEAMKQTEASFPTSADHFKLSLLEGSVVLKDGDVIFQVFCQDEWPGTMEMQREVIAEAIQAHFGTTERFAASYFAPIKSWGVIAYGLERRPDYSPDRHVLDFIQLLNDSFVELE